MKILNKGCSIATLKMSLRHSWWRCYYWGKCEWVNYFKS